MPVQVKAYCPNGGRYRDQPSDYENGKLPCASASEANRHTKQYARKDMGRRPGKGRENIGRIELAR
jgi:hypothetical protein